MAYDPLAAAQSQLRQTARLLSLEEGICERLLLPDRIIEVAIPITKDDGTTAVFRGYRAQHNNARGPYKGGIRFHPGVTREEVAALSMWMTWKTALLDLPLGGGKGGVTVDPKALSARELEALSRSFMRGIAAFIGPDRDIPAPDVSTDPRIMGYLLDEYEMLAGANRPGVITGKPLPLGGSLVRDFATAQGAFHAIERLSQKLALSPEPSVVIQGLGNGGGHLARLLSEAGYRVVGLGDSQASIYREEGLAVEEILLHKRTTGSLQGCPDCDTLPPSAVLGFPCDILVPAALENAIREENASLVRARAILEIANGPVSPEAEETLLARGILIVPDILANAGGVTVSYFEQVQNAANFAWTEAELLKRLEEKIAHAFDAAWEMKERYNTGFRQGAYLVAVGRVAEAMRYRGRV